MAALMLRMSGICEPMWKCTIFRMSVRPAACSLSTTRMSCAAFRPNLLFSPAVSDQRPAPVVDSLMRTPAVGSDAHLVGHLQQRVHLADLLEHDQHGVAELLPHERDSSL
jgi:hypothetical protein